MPRGPGDLPDPNESLIEALRDLLSSHYSDTPNIVYALAMLASAGYTTELGAIHRGADRTVADALCAIAHSLDSLDPVSTVDIEREIGKMTGAIEHVAEALEHIATALKKRVP